MTLVLLCLHSIIQSGLIAGGKDTKEGRQTVFCTAVKPMTDSQEDESYDVTKPRNVQYKIKWKMYQDAVHWINLKRAQDSWQTRSNAMILHDSVSADCLDKVVNTKLKRFYITHFPYHHVHHLELF